ncbi:PREDICTED: trimethylguanosine synthase isoform X2 [Fragaria vesca subsp. vesca]|uniref:trimethylguanosine synthase isoform X2 n=1 Tax=Fragaria vesca subsp. vesca TaxID=101020 RepID=UPI0002C30D34|nr:PREDICTED: trimethylguanosine synthase isoform X2 [Fragaria vesca subsp. vesca]
MKTKKKASKKRRTRRSKRSKLSHLPTQTQKRRVTEEGVSPVVEKYWFQRYDLFSKYDEGIQMDEQGWYSVTPEQIAITQAQRCQNPTVVIDCFAGVGGNAIQFASLCCHVVAIEIDPLKVDMAINNARIYGVEDYIDFIVGDFFQLAPSLKGDIVFLSPPWGGPSYRRVKKFTLDLLEPKDGYDLFQAAQAITPNIIMFLPRNVDLLQVEELCWLSSPPLEFEIEENYVHGKLKGVTVYFGGAAAGQYG